MTSSPRTALARALAVLLLAGAAAAPAVAQDGAQKPAAKPAAKPPAASTQAQSAQARRKAAGVPEPTSEAEMRKLPPADEEQLAAAKQVHYGKYICDDKYEVFIEANRIVDGYVDVRYQKDIWVMKPVASRTGALRLEDVRGQILMVQIPFKSMVLNVKTGQRIVDSCQHDVQKDAEREHRTAPPKAD